MKQNKNKARSVSARHSVLSLLIVWLIVTVLGSCTKEQFDSSELNRNGLEVQVTFLQSDVTRAVTGGTEVGTKDENRLDRVTIFVFNDGGTLLESVLSVDVTSANTSLATSQPKWARDRILFVNPIVNPANPKKIYAVANWNKTVFDKATYTESNLLSEIKTLTSVSDINDTSAYPMLMSGSKWVANLPSALYSVTVDMERQVSKIKAVLSMSATVQNYHPNIEWLTDQMKLTVANVPNKSYVVGRAAAPVNVSGYALLNSTAIAVDDTKPKAGDQTLPATKELKWSESVYVNENPVTGATPANKEKSTFIVVQLPYRNRATGITDPDNYYKLYVNDTRDVNSPHKVLRNTIYNFNIRLLGMGLPINNLIPDVNVDDELVVNSWEKGEIGDVEVPRNYFNVDRTHIEFQMFDTERKATLTTDVPDWKLVKADGTTVFSFADGQTADIMIDGITYRLSGNASTATITVTKPADYITFAKQQFHFVARNLKVPFTVVYDNGIIPSSVLAAAGWPADKLPLKGLQIAKRGNHLPTKFVPTGSGELHLLWGNPGWIGLEGAQCRGLGFGKSNTAKMLAYDSKNIVGNACKMLGAEWYLPSVDEILLIPANAGILGKSYLNIVINNYHWTSNEYSPFSDSYACIVTLFSIDYPNQVHLGKKSEQKYMVRCVRDL